MTIESVVKNVVAINHPAVAKVDYVAIAEAYFQKKCLPDEVVHHIDGNRENNAAENLVIMKRSQHSRLHSGLMGALDKWIEKVSNPLCGTCLYIRIYREHRGVHDDLVIESMFGIFHFDKEKFFENADQDRDKVILFCEEMYNDSIEWQRQNDHDCYANKNMHVVKRG